MTKRRAHLELLFDERFPNTTPRIREPIFELFFAYACHLHELRLILRRRIPVWRARASITKVNEEKPRWKSAHSEGKSGNAHRLLRVCEVLIGEQPFFQNRHRLR